MHWKIFSQIIVFKLTEGEKTNQVANVFAELKENWSDTKVATIFEIEKNIKSRKWESNNDSDEDASFPNDAEKGQNSLRTVSNLAFKRLAPLIATNKM